MKKSEYYWIKERYNPQLGIYYARCGNLSIKEAKQAEKTVYGSNRMIRFNSEKEYLKEIERIEGEGKSVL